MLTEDEARTLMHRAADTIEVSPGKPLPANLPRAGWPLLAAASAVIAIAVAAVVVTRDGNDLATPAAPTVDDSIEQPVGPDDITEEELALSLTQLQVAQAFVSWARGDETPPPFADQVEVLLDDESWWGTPMTADEARTRDLWSYCSGLPPEQCGINPLRILDEYDGHVVPTAALAVACAPEPRRLPVHLADAADDEVVRLDQPETRNCQDAWAIELWINARGRIRAVNLIE